MKQLNTKIDLIKTFIANLLFKRTEWLVSVPFIEPIKYKMQGQGVEYHLCAKT